MNEINRARLRLFCILLIVVIAAHALLLKLFLGGHSDDISTPEKSAETAAAAAPAPPPQPVYRYKVPNRNPYFGKPFNYAAAVQTLPPPLRALDGARNGILVDLDTHNVLWSKNSNAKVPVASMVKMMTLLLTFETLESDPRISLDSKVEITRTVLSVPRTGVIWLDPRETMPLSDLLKAVTIKSANDAAVQVAEFIGGDLGTFTEEMNKRADELGMRNSHFVNPCGLPDRKFGNSVSTPAEMVILAERLLEYPPLTHWSATATDWIRDRKTVLNNTNGMIRHGVPGVDGLKTGFINASGFCLTFTALRDGRRLAGCVTGFQNSRQRDKFCTQLLDWGYERIAELHKQTARRR